MSVAPVRTRTRPARHLAAACGIAVLLLVLSACGSKAQGSANAGAQTGGEGGRGSSQGGFRGGPPGASGKVAAVTGSTAQVQGTAGQVAVSWTSSTTFSKEVSATLADVKVGTCVFVTTSGEPSAGSTTPPTKVTAASVRITAKTNGTCAPGGRGSSRDQGARQPQGAPASGSPGNGARPQFRGMGGAVGQVTAVSATGFTVASAMASSNGTQQTSVTVTVAAGTTYSTTATGAASDVKVGVCLTAIGTTDDTGAVTAKTVTVSQPQNGQCGGFMRFRSGDGAAGAGNGQDS